MIESLAKLNFYFPFWTRDSIVEFDLEKLNYDFFGSKISFGLGFDSVEGVFGIEAYSKGGISDFIKKNKKLKEEVSEYFKSSILVPLYDALVLELKSSEEELIKLDSFVKEKPRIKPFLQETIQFQSVHEGFLLYDYFTSSNCEKLTEKVSFIGLLPKEILSEKYQFYHTFVKNHLRNSYNGNPSFYGKSLKECMQNAIKIYERHDELSELVLPSLKLPK